MIDRFVKWARKEYPLYFRLIGTLAAGVIFVILLPLLLLSLGPALDQTFNFTNPSPGIWPSIIGVVMMLVGAVFALWSIADQLVKAAGTPLPVMATQKLLITGPFKLCRNPMSFGTITMYLGLGVTIFSPGTVAIVIVLSALLILYIKRVEEKELQIRFGEAYRVYRESTPFLIPRFPR
jgi:protein-S-isoprenylcysteine O-methyltransferase Ste14